MVRNLAMDVSINGCQAPQKASFIEWRAQYLAESGDLAKKLSSVHEKQAVKTDNCASSGEKTDTTDKSHSRAERPCGWN